MAVGDVLLLRNVCRAPGQTSYNLSHWLTTAETAPVPALSTIVAQFETRFHLAYKAVMPSIVEWRGAGLRRVKPAPPSPEFFNITHAGPADLTSALLPTQTCGLITLLTQFSGRKFRGRKYVPFPSEEHNDADGVPTGPYLTALQGLANLFTTPLNVAAGGGSIDLSPVIYHRTAQTTDTIIGSVPKTVWATQRRRDGFHAGDLVPF